MVLQLYILSWAFSSCLRQINKSAVLFIPLALLKRLPSLVYYCLIFLFRIINCERWKFIYQLLSLESCNKLLKIRRVWNFICSSLMFFTLICSVECFVIFVNWVKSIFSHSTLVSVWFWPSNCKTGYLWPLNYQNSSILAIGWFWLAVLLTW